MHVCLPGGAAVDFCRLTADCGRTDWRIVNPEKRLQAIIKTLPIMTVREAGQTGHSRSPCLLCIAHIPRPRCALHWPAAGGFCCCVHGLLCSIETPVSGVPGNWKQTRDANQAFSAPSTVIARFPEDFRCALCCPALPGVRPVSLHCPASLLLPCRREPVLQAVPPAVRRRWFGSTRLRQLDFAAAPLGPLLPVAPHTGHRDTSCQDISRCGRWRAATSPAAG